MVATAMLMRRMEIRKAPVVNNGDVDEEDEDPQSAVNSTSGEYRLRWRAAVERRRGVTIEVKRQGSSKGA
jgi:hypothetical protein